jgi:hypothetical protein
LSVIYAFLFASLLVLAYHLAKVIIKRRIQTNNQIGDKTRAKLKVDLWKIFSRYIRLKDADWKGFTTCFTCDKYEDFRLVDAGHYLPKAGNSDALYFSELNVHVQCVNCNRLLDGNVKVYKERLIKKYGEGVILQLNLLRRSPPYTTQDYKQMIDKYTNLLKTLK